MEDMEMKTNISKLALIVASMLLLLAGAAFAVKGKKVQPSQVKASAVIEGARQVSPILRSRRVKSPLPRGTAVTCLLFKHSGTGVGYWSAYAEGIATVTYFDPSVCGSPTYPFDITAMAFTLYDDGSGMQWPVLLDVAVYDLTGSEDPCDGPGSVICTLSVSCDSATCAFPGTVEVTFPTPCSVNRPFYIGLKYADPGSGPFPSIIFDDNSSPTVCDNWHRYDGTWREWYDFWSEPGPGYPLFWVTGETPPATGHQIKRQVISSGGTEGASPGYQLLGTVCQTAVGSGSSPSYQVSHGFWPDFGGMECNCEPGDANADETVNLLDITYLISYLYKGGAAPIPYEVCSGDPNCDCTVNLLDITYLISYLYKDGAPPCTCEEWVSGCGPL